MIEVHQRGHDAKKLSLGITQCPGRRDGWLSIRPRKQNLGEFELGGGHIAQTTKVFTIRYGECLRFPRRVEQLSHSIEHLDAAHFRKFLLVPRKIVLTGLTIHEQVVVFRATYGVGQIFEICINAAQGRIQAGFKNPGQVCSIDFSLMQRIGTRLPEQDAESKSQEYKDQDQRDR